MHQGTVPLIIALAQQVTLGVIQVTLVQQRPQPVPRYYLMWMTAGVKTIAVLGFVHHLFVSAPLMEVPHQLKKLPHTTQDA